MVRKLDTKRTKIVCTIGPSSSDDDIIREMIRAGMDVARINFSHGDDATHIANVERVRRIAKEEGAVVAILCDLQGPKIRLGKLAKEPVMLKKGERLTLTTNETADGTNNIFPLPNPEFVHDVKPGNRLLLDDGALEFRVVSKQGDDLICEVVVPGPLSSRKGVSAPESHLTFSALTEKDRHDAETAINLKAEYIAMSFVRSGDDVRELRWLCRHLHGDIALISKIEKREAIENFADVLEASDGVMVARGDLGVETPAEEVPIHQKEIIRQCNMAGKPVITATQMLQSMVANPRPTRAEASDVANAIFDGTDAVMLSNETASGQYPVAAVQTMATIAQIAESHFTDDARRDFHNMTQITEGTAIDIMSDSTSRAAARIAEEVDAKLIIISTVSGFSARRVARQRPMTRIFCVTPDPVAYRRLALTWGVYPVLVPDFNTMDDMLKISVASAYDNDLVRYGDTVIVIAGVPFRFGGATNFLKIHVVGELGEVPEVPLRQEVE